MKQEEEDKKIQRELDNYERVENIKKFFNQSSLLQYYLEFDFISDVAETASVPTEVSHHSPGGVCHHGGGHCPPDTLPPLVLDEAPGLCQ